MARALRSELDNNGGTHSLLEAFGAATYVHVNTTFNASQVGLVPEDMHSLTSHWGNASQPNGESGPQASETLNHSLTLEQEQTLELMTYWLSGVINNIVVILGLIGNLLTIVILSQRAMRSSTNYYLLSLALWDSVVLLCTMLLISLPAVPSMQDYHDHEYAYVVAYVYPVALTAQTATIWLTVSFTVERYIAVCHPLKAATMCTIKRAKYMIISVSIGSTIYNLPRWFDYAPIAVEKNNITAIRPLQTDFGKNPFYVQIYFSWLYVPFMCIIPLLVLSILNTFLILAVRKSQQQRKDMNVRQCRENNVTIMLTSVVIVFIFCQVPALVYNLAYAIDRAMVQATFGYQALSQTRNFLVNLNSAFNFLLYCALGQKFRRIFLHTFCRRCNKDFYHPVSGGMNVSHSPQQQSTFLHNKYRRCNNNKMNGRKLPSEVMCLNHSTATTQTVLSRCSPKEAALLRDAEPLKPHPVTYSRMRSMDHPTNNTDDDHIFKQRNTDKTMRVYYKTDFTRGSAL